jgi:hypothetical protein
VKVDHGFGIETLYGHLAKALVKEGQRVKRGEVVGLVGSSGLATGPHLHYMVKVNGQALDPVKYILESLVKLPASLTGSSSTDSVHGEAALNSPLPSNNAHRIDSTPMLYCRAVTVVEIMPLLNL